MKENKIIFVKNVAAVFMSKPMTLGELSKRVSMSKDEVLNVFNNDLKDVDYGMYVSVQKILDYLKLVS